MCTESDPRLDWSGGSLTPRGFSAAEELAAVGTSMRNFAYATEVYVHIERSEENHIVIVPSRPLFLYFSAPLFLYRCGPSRTSPVASPWIYLPLSAARAALLSLFISTLDIYEIGRSDPGDIAPRCSPLFYRCDTMLPRFYSVTGTASNFRAPLELFRPYPSSPLSLFTCYRVFSRSLIVEKRGRTDCRTMAYVLKRENCPCCCCLLFCVLTNKIKIIYWDVVYISLNYYQCCFAF